MIDGATLLTGGRSLRLRGNVVRAYFSPLPFLRKVSCPSSSPDLHFFLIFLILTSYFKSMLAIKFKRAGKKHQATFRVVVMERRSKLNGRFVDDLGWMDPHADTFSVRKEEAKRWISVGAQPTPSVHNLFVRVGVIDAPKIPVHNVPRKQEAPQKSDSAGIAADKGGVVPAPSEEKEKTWASETASTGKTT